MKLDVIRDSRQLRLNVRYYKVGVRGFGDIQIQAATPAAAKYGVFKMAREAGYFTNMRRVPSRVAGVRELRR